MAEKKETAEQKLLKIIETQKGDPATPAAASSENQDVALKFAEAVKNPGISPSTVFSFLEPLLGLMKGKFSSPSAMPLGVREVNKVLTVVLILVVSVFILNIFSDSRLLKKHINVSIETSTLQNNDIFTPQAKAISDYLENINKRNIFQPYEKKAEDNTEALPTESKKIMTLAKNFRLVGISWLDSPDTASAMIEDTANGTTHFLRAGEKLNDVLIKNIYADRVILSYEGEEVALKL